MKLLQEKTPAAAQFRDLNECMAYAVQFRYDAMESESAPINREDAVQRLEGLRQQVRRRLAEVEGV